jgi:hypothetical protein
MTTPTTTLPRVLRAEDAPCCTGCGLIAPRLYAVAGFGGARLCWRCLLTFGRKLIAALRAAEAEYQYDRFNNESSGGY